MIVYSPMASGLLTGAMTRERAASLPDDDWRRANAIFNEPKLSQNLRTGRTPSGIGNATGATPGEVAIAWTLSNPAVTAAIVGARNASQADGIMRAGELSLTDEEVGELESFSVQSAA